MKYTEGKLQLWTSNSFRRFGTSAGKLVCEPITQHSDGHPDLYFRNGGPDGPDARRMLACWNACEGIETKYLETTTSLREADIARKVATERDIDELLAKLRGLYDAVQRGDYDHVGPGASAACIEARAVLETHGDKFDEFVKRVPGEKVPG